MTILQRFNFWLNRTFLYTKRPDGKFILRQEERLISNLSKRWKRQKQYYLDQIKNFNEFKIENNNLQLNLFEMFENDPEKENIAKDINEAQAMTINRGQKRGYAIIAGFGKVISGREEVEKTVFDWLQSQLSHQLSQRDGAISNYTERRISELVLEAARNGETYTQLAEKIEDQGKAGVFSAARAKTIAVRELGVAYEQGKVIPIKQYQLEFPEDTIVKWWQTVNDNRVTDLCNDNQETGKILIDGLFPSGDSEAPRSGNIRCRCSTQYNLEDPNE